MTTTYETNTCPTCGKFGSTILLGDDEQCPECVDRVGGTPPAIEWERLKGLDGPGMHVLRIAGQTAFQLWRTSRTCFTGWLYTETRIIRQQICTTKLNEAKAAAVAIWRMQ